MCNNVKYSPIVLEQIAERLLHDFNTIKVKFDEFIRPEM